MILLEAMWAEVPILATSVGGVPDVVSARESILCEPASAKSIAHAIDALCVEPARGEQLSARALERVSTAFGTESWISAHVQLYQGAVNALSAGVSRRRQHA